MRKRNKKARGVRGGRVYKRKRRKETRKRNIYIRICEIIKKERIGTG